jgi:hypothetical protein
MIQDKLKYLYGFSHIPKTAGTAIQFHIAHNSQNDEVLWVYQSINFLDVKTDEKNVIGTHEEKNCDNKIKFVI